MNIKYFEINLTKHVQYLSDLKALMRLIKGIKWKDRVYI